MTYFTTRPTIRTFLMVIITVIMAAQVSASNKGTPAAQSNKVRYQADELLVKFIPGIAAEKANVVARGAGATKIKNFRRPRQLKASVMDRWRHIKLTPGADIEKVRARLLKNPNVEIVEYNYDITAHLAPNDPDFTTLWGLHNSGQTSGLIDADIDATETWDITTGNSNVIVAVIDTGVDYTHEDLAGNIWTNAAEIPDNGIDDDQNGYIDDVYGYDFFNNDADPMDDSGHGTHVAGTIAATGNNGIGITGISWNARIMAIKFLSPQGGHASDAVKAILYATDMGASVMNNSWGLKFYSQLVKDTIAATEAAGILFVASAGNNYQDSDRYPKYPAAFDLDNIISVAATDHNDNKADFSNYGKVSVDLGAPGVDIYSTVPVALYSSGYLALEGTSMAGPHVTGAAALLLSQYPTLSYQELKLRLLSSVDVVDTLTGKTVSDGRLNVFSAIDDDSIAPAAITDLTVNSVSSFAVKLDWSASGDDDNSGTSHHYDIRFSTSIIDASNFDTATPVDKMYTTGAAGSPESVTVPNLRPDTTYYFAIKVVDNVGNRSNISNVVTAALSPARAIFFDDLEWGSDNWGNLSWSPPWHLSTHRANSPLSALYYGDEETLSYNNGTVHSGKITSIPIDLTNIANVTEASLFLNHFLDLDGTTALARIKVQVTEADSSFFIDELLVLNKGTQGKFAPLGFDLSAYVGKTIRIQFEFFTSGSEEVHEGWVIDDVVVYVPQTLNNQAPSAHAGGPYTTYRNEQLTFNSSASSDADGDPLLYKWDFGDGSRGTGVNSTHRYAASGSYTVTLIVNDGQLDSAPITTTVTVTNRAPLADAGGPYNGYKNKSVNFDGTGSSDADGDTLTYKWNFGDGSTLIETGAAGASPSHTYSSLGVYNISLKVSDGEADSASVTTTATVSNRAPVADVGGPYSAYKNDTITFNGLASSDVDGDTLSYHWDFGDGNTATGANPSYMYTSSGYFTVSLVVSDGLTNSAAATTKATISNRSPVAEADGPYSAFRNGTINFNGLASSDPDGDTLTYHWNFGDRTTATGATPSHVYSKSGTYTVSLTVSDGSVFSRVRTTATITNRAPIADIGGPYTGVTRELIKFDVLNSSDPDGDTLFYYWTFIDNCDFVSCRGYGPTPVHVYTAPGVYTVTLTVSDGEASITKTTTVTINNHIPTAVTNGPYFGNKNSSVRFDARGSSDADSDRLSYHWNFGDGTTGTGLELHHVYTASGTYTVTVIVNDGYADSQPATTTATISNRIPTANAGGPYSGYKNTAINFNGTASTDPDGDSLSYQWNFGDGTPIATGPTPAHSYSTTGSYTVTLKVNDGEADSASIVTTVSVNNRAPVANPGGPYPEIFRNQSISFNGLASTDADGDKLTYQWNFGDGTTATGTTPTHSYKSSGSYTITLIVNDSEASSTPVSTNIIVNNRAPVANVGGTYADVFKNDSVTFNGSASSDADGNDLTYQWNFGDGTTGTGITPNHSYANIGTYTVILIVNDGEDNSTPVNTSITVLNRAPIANAGVDQTVKQRTTTTLDGTASNDPDGSIASYNWSQLSGPGVSLSNAGTANPSFTSPQLKGLSQVILLFSLVVTDDNGIQSSTDQVTITVVKN